MSDRKSRHEAEVRVACIQMEPVVGEKDRNLARSLQMIDEAAGQGARLIVLPELANSGYVFESRNEAIALAEEIPSGPTTTAWAAAAARHGAWIVAGIAERAEGCLYIPPSSSDRGALLALSARSICGTRRTCSSSQVIVGSQCFTRPSDASPC